MVIVEPFARMRSGPSVSNSTLHQFFEATQIEALSFDRLYWMVLYDNKVGYVIASSIQADAETRAFFSSNELPLDPTAQPGSTVATLEGNPEPTPFEPEPAPAPTDSTGQVRTLPEPMAEVEEAASQDPVAVPSTAAPTILRGRNLVFRAGVGTALPLAPPKFPDLWARGISFHGSLGYGVNSYAEVGVEFSYSELALERDQVFTLTGLVEEVDEVVDGNVKVSTVMGYLKLNAFPVFEKVSPYVLFGGGSFGFAPADVRIAGNEGPIRDTEETDFLFRKKETVGGFMLGVGVDVRMAGSVYLFAEGRGVFGLTEREGTFVTPFRAGFMIRY